MGSKSSQLLLEKQRSLPPGTRPQFAPPDRAKKEAAILYLTAEWKPPRYGGPIPTHRAAPTGPTASSPKSHRAAPAKPTIVHDQVYGKVERTTFENKIPKVLERCIIAYPDPNCATIRPYMGKAAGTCSHRAAWGLPYKAARGCVFPPQSTRMVYYAWN